MHAHLVVRGRVQGVGFRWFVRESARALGVDGWVRNRADGTVEVAATGSEAAIERLRAALGDGPRGAVVSSVDDLTGLDETLPRPFTILR